MQKKKQNEGQSLIEVLLAAVVVGIALTALVSVTTASVARNREAKERSVATRLAQETAEAYRIVRDTQGWDLFIQAVLGQDSDTDGIITSCVDNTSLLNINNLGTSLFTDFVADSASDNVTDIMTALAACDSDFGTGRTFRRGTYAAYDDTPGSGTFNYTIVVFWPTSSRIDHVAVSGQIQEKD